MNARLCCAYLRAYQPLDAFPPDERAQIQRVIADPTLARPQSGRGTPELLTPQESLETYLTVVDGEPYACPARTRLRTLLSLIACERWLPSGVRPVFFSDGEIRDARRELEAMRAAQPGVQPTMLQSAWHVPLQWFACFADAERRIVHDGDHPRIVYRTLVGRAHDRLKDALDTLKGGTVHPAYIGVIFELQEWLAALHPDGILELDYASVATLFDPDELADDHSASEIWASIEALGTGDGRRAAGEFRRATERWVRARQRESLN